MMLFCFCHHLYLQHCNILNPGTLLLLPNEGEPHDREVLASYFMTPHPDPRHTPLTNSDLILFVDEPYCKNEKGKFPGWLCYYHPI